MGAQFSKTAGKEGIVAEKPGEAAASPSKANGQENGHVKVNGEASAVDGESKEEVQANGSAAQEPVPNEEGEKAEESPAEKATEVEKVNTEPVASTEGEPAKVEDGADPSTSSETPKKKKKHFSFKKSFKLSGFSFKKGKKEKGEGGEEAAASEEAAAGEEAAASEQAKTEGAEAVEGGTSKEEAKLAEEVTPATGSPSPAKPEEMPLKKPEEEPKAASAGTEDPEEVAKPPESAVAEHTLSHNEAPAREETAPQEMESSPAAPAESTAE